MKKFTFLIVTVCLIMNTSNLHAQGGVAINTDGSLPDSSAMLDVKSTDKGMLVPRMTITERDGISIPAKGLLVFCTDNNQYYTNKGIPSAPIWVMISTQWFANGSNIYFNSGNVGIGTSNPNADLDIRSNGTDVPAVFSIGNSDRTHSLSFFPGRETDPNPFIQWKAGDPLRFSTDEGGWSEKMRIDSSGKVGIGTTTPYTGLHVKGDDWPNSFLALQSDEDKNAGIRFYEGDIVKWHIFNNASDNGLIIYNSNGSRITYFANQITGNVGIGTGTPDESAILDLNSNSKGFLPPRMSTSQMNAITTPAAGLMVYNTTMNSVFCYNGSSWMMLFSNDGVSCGTISYGGQTYQTVIIGSQCWMTENLNIGTRVDGANDQIDDDIIEKYCYDDEPDSCDIYGGLYQWDEIMQYVTTEGTQGICPTGWHLPTDDEWKTMEMYLGMSQVQADATGYRGTDEGEKLKSTSGWYSGGNGANSSGFTALPGGYRFTSGNFHNLGSTGYWWSTTEQSSTSAWIRSLNYDFGKVGRNNYGKDYGFSVRCLRD